MAKKILIIEDEPEQRMAAKIRLEAGGYEFISAIDGEEGLKKVNQEKPDLILLDVIMPKIDGYGVCKRLKDNPSTKDIPIIIVTASGARDLERKCLAVGAVGIIQKPYESKDLIEKIKTLLKE